MEIIKTSLDEVSGLVLGILSDQREAVVYCVADDHCAVVGSNGGADLEQIQKAGIKMVQIKHEGGTIVLSPGDVDIGIFTEGYQGHEYRNEIIDRLINRLQENGHEAFIEDNDVLVNGRKVVGFGSRMFGKILYTAIHIAVKTNIDLIKSICTKDMKKVPDALTNYGINTAYVLNIMSEVFKQKLN